MNGCHIRKIRHGHIVTVNEHKEHSSTTIMLDIYMNAWTKDHEQQ